MRVSVLVATTVMKAAASNLHRWCFFVPCAFRDKVILA